MSYDSSLLILLLSYETFLSNSSAYTLQFISILLIYSFLLSFLPSFLLIFPTSFLPSFLSFILPSFLSFFLYSCHNSTILFPTLSVQKISQLTFNPYFISTNLFSTVVRDPCSLGLPSPYFKKKKLKKNWSTFFLYGNVYFSECSVTQTCASHDFYCFCCK